MAPSRSLIKILIVWMRGLSAPWWRVASKLNKCVMMAVVRVVLCEELIIWMKCSPCLGNESMSSSATKGLSWWLVSELEVSKTMSPDLFEFLNIPSQSKNLFLNGVVLWQWGYLPFQNPIYCQCLFITCNGRYVIFTVFPWRLLFGIAESQLITSAAAYKSQLNYHSLLGII